MFTILVLLFFRMSLFLTSLMSVQRLMAITHPSYVIRAKLIYMVLLVWLLNMIGCFVMYLIDIG